jgi:hypothetical protein
MEDMVSIVRVATIENEVEAQLLDTILEEQGIPHHVKSYHDVIYDGIFQIQRGWGYVSAPEGYRDQVMDILEDIRKGLDPPDEGGI